MVTVPRKPEEEGVEEEGQDETKRYDNDIPDEDAFEELVRQADQMIQVTERQSQATKPSLTDEQKERMLKNRQLAEQRRLAKQKEREEAAAKAKEDKENTMDESNKPDDAFGDDDDFLVIDSKAGEPDPEPALDDEALMKALEDDGDGIMETEQPLSQKLWSRHHVFYMWSEQYINTATNQSASHETLHLGAFWLQKFISVLCRKFEIKVWARNPIPPLSFDHLQLLTEWSFGVNETESEWRFAQRPFSPKKSVGGFSSRLIPYII